MSTMATASTCAAAIRFATARVASTSRARRTAPCTSTRSGTVYLSLRGTSTFGRSMNTSYWSKRPSSAISRLSRKPSVAISAVLAPLRSMMALVASVVPCTSTAMSANASPARFSAAAVPLSTASSGALWVVSTFAVIRPFGVSSTISVNVPPISAANRTASSPATLILVTCSVAGRRTYKRATEQTSRAPRIAIRTTTSAGRPRDTGS